MTLFLVMPTFKIASKLDMDGIITAITKHCSGKRRWLSKHFHDFIIEKAGEQHGLHVYEISSSVGAKFYTVPQFAEFLSEIVAPGTFANMTFFSNFEGSFGFLITEGRARSVTFKATVSGELQETFLAKLFKGKEKKSLDSLSDDEQAKMPASIAAKLPCPEEASSVAVASPAPSTAAPSEKPAATAKKAHNEAKEMVAKTDEMAARSIRRKSEKSQLDDNQLSLFAA